MSDKRQNPISAFLAAPPDTMGKTLFVAVAVCLVASMIVAAVAVALRPVQEANSLIDKQRSILGLAGLLEPGMNVPETFAQAFESQYLELATGEFTDRSDVVGLSDREIADDPALSRALADDPAAIIRQGNFVQIYILRNDTGGVKKVILPIHGYGLWSTLYGFIAIEADGNSIFGLQFYDHAETPGLGAEVDNPRWKAMWNGKRLVDAQGVLQIQVAKAPSAAGEDFHIDALAGATLTSAGVNNLVRFWMGDEGYAPFLEKMKAGEI